MLFGKVSTLFLGLIASGLLARILSPEDMGIYVFIESIVLTAAIFSQLGLGLTSVKLVAHYTAKGDQVATQNTIFFILKLTGLGSIFTSFFLFFFGEKIGIPGSLIYCTGGWVVLVAMQQLFANIFRGSQDFRSVVLIDGSKIGGIITTCIAVVFLFFIWRFLGSLDLISVFPYLLIGGIPTLFFALLSLSKKIQIYTMIRSNQILNRGEILTMAFPILVTTLTTTLLSRSGVWVATAFRIPSEVAVFGVIMRLVALISIPMNLFVQKTVYLRNSGVAEVDVQYDRAQLRKPGIYTGRVIAAAPRQRGKPPMKMWSSSWSAPSSSPTPSPPKRSSPPQRQPSGSSRG